MWKPLFKLGEYLIDLNGQLQRLLQTGVIGEGPDKIIWEIVQPFVKRERYRCICDYKGVEKAVCAIQDDLGSVYLMRNFKRLGVFLDKLKQVNNHVLFVSVRFWLCTQVWN